MSQKFYSDIEARAGLMDSSGALGTSGQILSSTGSNVSWINQSTAANDVQNRVKAGVAINKGQAVYVTGADGTNIIVGLASNASEATSSKTLGLLNATVAINGMADVVQIGRLSGLNTLGATAGDPVWLGTGGNLIYGLINKPYAPANLVFIGIVTRVNVSNGEIFVNVQNGFELNEIHDVDLKTNVPINGDVLGFNGTLWVNKTIAGWLGYTPANASGTTNYVSKFTGTTSLGNSLLFDNGTNVGIGTTSPSGKLDVIGNLYTSGEFRIGASYAATGTGLIKSNSGVLSLFTWGDSTNIQIGGSDVVFKPEAGSERMRLTSAGNLGVGVSAPGYKTQIESSSSVVFLSKNTSSTSFNRSYFYNNSDVGIQIQAYGSAYPFGTLWPGGANSADITCNAANGLAIGTSTASAFVLGTNSAERMRIDSSGNILVGQTSAIYSATNRANLTIGKSAGSIIVLGTSTAANGYLFYNNTDIELANSTSSGSVFFRTSGTERMRIASGGNVGIGTSSAFSKVEIAGAATGWSNSPAITFTDNAGTVNSRRWLIGNVATDYGSLNFAVSTTNSDNPTNPKMTITKEGNVGIGTTSPGHKLQVSGTAGTSWSTLLQSNSKSAVYSAHADGYGMAIETSQNTSAIYTFKVAGGDGTNIGTNEYFRITGTGNVGIGTSSPSEKLVVGNLGGGVKRIYVPGTYNFDGSYLSNYDGNGGGKLELVAHTGVSNSASWRIANNNDTYGQSLTFSYAPNTTSYSGLSYSAPAMLIANTGNVGIGTTSPTKRLDIVSSTNDSFDAIVVRPLNQTQTLNIGWQGIATSLNFIVSTNGSEKMRVDTAGNVGIGTTTPAGKLNAIGDIIAGSYTYTTGVNLQNRTAKSLLYISTDGVNNAVGSTITYTWADGGQGPLKFNNTSGEVMRLDASGNLGIGTTSPGAKLDVNGDALINGLTVGRGGGNSAFNTALGVGALSSNTSGEYNVAIGRSANTSNNISGTTVIGADLFTNPSGVSGLTSNSIAISQYNPNNAGTQYPHFYAPDKIECPNNGAITDILSIDWSIYTAAFIEYSLFNSGGNEFRAGTYTIAFKISGTPVDIDEKTVVYNNTTLDARFTYSQNGSVHTIQIENSDNDTYNIRITARLLMR